MDLEPLVRMAFVVIAGWFWLHCARPCLVAMRARVTATRLVLGVTLVSMAVYAAAAVARITGVAGSITYQLMVVSGVAWMLVVGGGYLTQYRILIRATGGPDRLGSSVDR